MSLDDFATFVAVARHGSFSRAAAELGVHRSVVSRRVAALEQALGVELLLRTTRHVAPSAVGRRLLEHAEGPLAAVTAALGNLPEMGDAPAGPLRISAPPDVALHLLPPTLGRLAAEFPEIRPSVHVSNALVDLEADGYDAALRVAMNGLPSSNLRARRLGRIRTNLFASPDYVARNGAPGDVGDLSGHLLVGLSGAVPADLGLETVVTAGDMVMAAELARAGVGVAVLPWFLVGDSVTRGTLIPLLSDAPFGEGTLYLVFPGTQALPAKSAAFRDALLATLAERPLE